MNLAFFLDNSYAYLVNCSAFAAWLTNSSAMTLLLHRPLCLFFILIFRFDLLLACFAIFFPGTRAQTQQRIREAKSPILPLSLLEDRQQDSIHSSPGYLLMMCIAWAVGCGLWAFTAPVRRAAHPPQIRFCTCIGQRLRFVAGISQQAPK